MKEQETTESVTEVGLFEGLGLDPSLYVETLKSQELALMQWRDSHFERVRNALSAELACSQ